MAQGAAQSGRVLIVDDEPMISYILSRYFRQFGMEVVEARTGENALEQLMLAQFDVVFLDFFLPDTTAQRIYEAVNEACPRRTERFIILTGAVENAQVSMFIANSGLPCMSKPFTFEELSQHLVGIGTPREWSDPIDMELKTVS